MAGCMIETSLGISAIAQLAPLLDTADFDGAALLADDPFVGAGDTRRAITLTDDPGLGREAQGGVTRARAPTGRGRAAGTALPDFHVRDRSGRGQSDRGRKPRRGSVPAQVARSE